MELKDFNEVFKHIDEYTWWPCDVDPHKIFDIAKNNLSSLTKNATKNHFMVRTAGQSGSGKTTQLFPACKTLMDRLNITPVHLCVREFAALHPNYDEINEKYGKSEMRERTNGFALRCLVVSLGLALEAGYDILFEVTILAPKFEKFVVENAKKFGYKNVYLCLAVSKSLSDSFIEKRKQGRSFENGRIISSSSSTFFYNILEDAISFIAKVSGGERIIVWDAYKKRPIYDGKMKNALPVIKRGRAEKSYLRYSEESLKVAKTNYLIKHITLD